jgi:alpha-maltose-1-phosphate synthase
MPLLVASDRYSNTYSSTSSPSVKVLFFTNEYPPHTYGGAGVHVDYLTRELAKSMPVEVRCFGDQRVDRGNLKVTGFEVDASGFTCPKPLQSVFGAVRRCTDFNTMLIDADLVHCHTWYTHFGGILAKKNYGIPLVITVHSLEPLRPWKREQLAGGYDFSVWVEKTALEMADAVIAVSRGTKADIERLFQVDPKRVPVIYNGIDLEEYHKVDSTEALVRHGVDPAKPYLLFVGRITRQKGIIHLVRAIQFMDPGFQVVLCAGAPDTPEIADEMGRAVEQAKAIRQSGPDRPDIIWIQEMLDKKSVIEFYSHAAVFCCPSIYEPFGIINLEAMACETAVVASAVGGIKEVVVDGETGFLVPVEQMQESPFEPINPEKFSRDLAAKINQLMANPALREKFGKAGRKRAEEKFSWSAIARETKALYESLVKSHR